MFKAFFFNRSNKLIVQFDVESMDAARVWAAEYNRDPGALGQVELIGNASVPAHCTRITAVYPPATQGLPLFDR